LGNIKYNAVSGPVGILDVLHAFKVFGEVSEAVEGGLVGRNERWQDNYVACAVLPDVGHGGLDGLVPISREDWEVKIGRKRFDDISDEQIDISSACGWTHRCREE
jgi:hypothetical protein